MNESKITAFDLQQHLEARYSGREWIFLPQFRSSTGTMHIRSADGIAMNMYESRGCAIHAFEIKVARSDWLQELRQPAKAQEICSCCDFFWLVVPDASLVKEGELPLTWGMLVLTDAGLRVKVQAQRQVRENQYMLPYGFVASLLRATKDFISPLVEVEKQARAEYKRGYEEGRKSLQPEQDARIERELVDLKKRVADFEKKSGIELHEWRMGEVANIVRMLTDENDLHNLDYHTRGLLKHGGRVLAGIRAAQKQINAVKEKSPEGQTNG